MNRSDELRKQKNKIETHYNNLIQQLFVEEPVSVLEFLSNKHYLGESTRGGDDIFPVWKDALKTMFEDGSKTTVVLTGSTSTGKSSVAVWGLAYVQYLHMCLKKPWRFYELADSGKMAISFFNLNRTLGASRGYTKLQTALFRSPWFKKHATRITKVRSDLEGKESGDLEFSLFKYLLSSPMSQGFGILGEEIISGVLDEVDNPIASLKQKEKIIEVFNATERRFKQRFAATGYSLGKLFIVSSKQDEMSFIDTFIAKQKRSPDVLIFDIPLWDAKPAHLFSGIRFPVAVGDAYHPPQMVEINPDTPVPIPPGFALSAEQKAAFTTFSDEYTKKGYKIINVPIEFKKEFRLGLLGALKDIGGETVAGIRRSKLFASESFILSCIDSTKQDPVNVPVIETGLKDAIDFIKYFDLSKIRVSKNIPRYFHYDIAFSGEGDACSLAMSAVKDWKVVDIQNEDGTYRKELVPVIETDFVVRIKARAGDRMPFHKVRKLVLDIRAAGYTIALFTADLKNMSEDTQQLLLQAGITTDDLSLDKSPQPYFNFRDLVNENRWICHNVPLLNVELRELEHNIVDGKVDHPAEFLSVDGTVLKGSKDLSDAVAGAAYNCIKYAVKPMDVDLLNRLMQKKKDTNEDPEVDISKLFGPSEDRPIGTQTKSEGIEKINSIFKRINNR